ncbi:hypothetical protein MBLNU230_g5850t1 [Neophaeotheca triangularis]
MPRKDLTITPTPYKSSRLAIPPSPFSPRLPLSPPLPPSPSKSRPNSFLASSHSHAHSHSRTPSTATPNSNSTKTALLALHPPPPNPLHWLWQCHLCNRIYQLSVTRRCLDDGHYFCAGTTTVKRTRKSGKRVVRHRACASEFDYAGWKAWGTWRRDLGDRIKAGEKAGFLDVVGEGKGWWRRSWGRAGVGLAGLAAGGGGQRLKTGREKDCFNGCDYPSECRWGKQYGVQSPVVVPVPPPPPPPPPPPSVEKKKSRKGKNMELAHDVSATASPMTSFDDILALLPPKCTNTTTTTTTTTNPPTTNPPPPSTNPSPKTPTEPTTNPNAPLPTLSRVESRPHPSTPPPPLLPPDSTPMPTAAEVHSSAVRRKRRSAPSPLGPQAAPPSLGSATAAAVASRGSTPGVPEARAEGAETATVDSGLPPGLPPGRGESVIVGSTAEMLARVIDEIEGDLRKGWGRVVGRGWAGGSGRGRGEDGRSGTAGGRAAGGKGV